MLSESKLVQNQTEVCNIFNDFFVNIAGELGTDNTENVSSSNPCEHIVRDEDDAYFKPVNCNTILNKLDKIDVNKSTGVDGVSPKLLKLAAVPLAPTITTLVNQSITSSRFPNDLKKALVTPVHKKKDPLRKVNYRPVSILPCISKIFEGVISDKLSAIFDQTFSPFLSAFRKGFCCQTVLLKLLEDWRKSLDNNKYVGAVLMDLSKAFDCLPHKLLLDKLRAYGLSDSAVSLIQSYLQGRSQQVKLGEAVSDWRNIVKGVPQGSILGPILFNIFINDIFYSSMECDIYNYADDNTLSDSNTDVNALIENLERAAVKATDWFRCNSMVANPEKFQAIVIDPKTRNTSDTPYTFVFRDITISTKSEVTILGVHVDNKLNFNSHIKMICTKAARQLNVLKRFNRLLDFNSRLAVFNSFILSNFNYCPLVWHFCGEANTRKLEKLHHRALCFVYKSNDSYENLLARADRCTLRVSRFRLIAREVYKIINKTAPDMLHDLIKIRTSKYALRRSTTQISLDIPSVKTSRFGDHSFRKQAVSIWNSLPNDLRSTTNYSKF